MIKDLTESYESLISKYDKGEITLSVVFDEIQKLLKTAEPIRCKDCKHWERQVGLASDGLGDCTYHGWKLVTSNGYCFWAERKSDGCNCS